MKLIFRLLLVGVQNLKPAELYQNVLQSSFFLFLSSFLALVESIMGPREFLSNILDRYSE